jgi:hypothetical protein
MASTDDILNSPSYINEDESVTRDQDRSLLIWFCTNGGTLCSLSTYLNNQKVTFGLRLTAKQKKRFSNRIQHLKRLWRPDNKTPFTTLLRFRGFDKLASEIEQDEVVPKYALSRAYTTPTRSTPSATSPVASSVTPLVARSHHSTTTKKEQNTAIKASPILSPNTPRRIQFDTREPPVVSDTKTIMSHLAASKQNVSSKCIPQYAHA